MTTKSWNKRLYIKYTLGTVYYTFLEFDLFCFLVVWVSSNSDGPRCCFNLHRVLRLLDRLVLLALLPDGITQTLRASGLKTGQRWQEGLLLSSGGRQSAMEDKMPPVL